MAALGPGSQNVTEYVVRVPKNTTKKYNIMAFNAADKVNFATWNQARLERDLSNKKIYQEEEMPESGAGSEFNRKLREEARRKKYGIVLKEFRPEDQPWLLRVNGKSGRKFKGIKKGGVTENTSYYIFTQCPDGAFEAFPVHNWYNFTPLARHRTLTAEEAEEEWERRNKVLNHFSIMQQRRLKDQDQDEEDEEKEKRSRKKASELRIHDLEDDLEMSSDDSEASGEEGGRAPKAKKKAPPAKGGRKKKKKKGSDDEAFEDSDDGDFEGQEVDYMSDGSSSSQDELEGKPKVTQQEEGPKGVDEQSESSEESEEEKPPEEDKEEEEEKKAPTPQEKKRRKDSSDESDSSEESDIDSEASSALFMAKKKTPPKRERRPSGGSSRGNSRPGTPSAESGSTSSTLRAAATKLEQGKRTNETPVAKRLRLDAGPQSLSGKSTPQPQSGKSTPSSGDVQVTEDAVRRYLTRKPMTTKDLLKKFQTKKTGLSSEQTVNVLAQILKRLNPERKMISDKMHFSLKE
ncbi:general transcription factor IIF subunit 1 isoform X1 [Prionailurus viverrinus]|uniref:Transcription initiation factor IIF subunit alpha n=3 Tax=Felinae TaxID=338152 RepID=A0ABI8ASG4_FELCA|nr:general transcription factor IIF subunit 1 isoform X1 [Felis catus]XP_030149396.1 general transcription factor IIF subunit 1 isoform X1 [Lynx canadensis]XP_040317605.1 general transcription factor IIF subunit 1 isoform X1 [Puma yagouaroundi]XP_042833874.1 general transcription factor IIF subunit 1 isoform X1 [Panthera tigris]XP_042833875.1 general transcription factor IIF subunit 1 isoform X1 [Panthera tigris]XP_043442288.1 general transcription factor IIF subunit 1 isoform X2 [Prionailurus